MKLDGDFVQVIFLWLTVFKTKEYNAHNGLGLIMCEITISTLASGEQFKSISDIYGRLLAIHYLDGRENECSLFTNFLIAMDVKMLAPVVIPIERLIFGF